MELRRSPACFETTTLWKFQLSFINFLTFFGLTEPPTPQEIPIPSVGEYGYFLELHILSDVFYAFSQLNIFLTITLQFKPNCKATTPNVLLVIYWFWLFSGFVPFFRNKFPGLFHDFSRTQIDFSRPLKFTLTPTLLRSKC